MPRLTPRLPLSAEAVDHAKRRAVGVFNGEHPDCDVTGVLLCGCGCSAMLHTTCSEWDPAVVFTDPVRVLPW